MPRAPLAGLGRGWAWNTLKTGVLLGGLTALVVLVANHLGGTTWALGALAVMGATNFGSWWFSDRIVVAMHGGQEIPVEEAPRLHAILDRLAARAGIPTPRLVWVPDRAPNAFATGRSVDHAVVAVTQGLLDLLDEAEIEGVLAHELSHVTNRDMLVMTVAATLAGAVSLVARMAGWAMLLGGGRDDDRRGSGLEALLLVVLAPIMALLVQLAVSRSREYGAEDESHRRPSS